MLRRWLAFGSGAAAVIGEHDLELCAVSLRRGRVRLAGEMRVENWREHPAAEWGSEINAWLRKCGLSHVPLWVVLPEEEALARSITLPGVTDADARAAIEFQLEGLHPFGEDAVAADWRRIGETAWFTIALCRREVLDGCISLFGEAGIKLAGITAGASVLHTALRRASTPPVEGLLAIHGLEAGELEPVAIYGEGPGHPLFWNRFDLPAERAVPLASAELRLAEDAAPRDLAELLPPLDGAPGDTDFSRPARSRGAFRYAAALAAACPHLGAPVNLLPPELRAVTSPVRYVPTAILGAAAACAGLVLLLQGGWENRNYLSLVEAEIRKVEPQARQLEKEEKDLRDLAARVAQLDEFRQRTRRDLDALLELTALLPPPGWSNGVVLSRDTVQVGGEAEQAEALLKVFDGSPLFQESQLTAPISRTGAVEAFRITTKRSPNPPMRTGASASPPVAPGDQAGKGARP